ncbi:transcription elongation factor S-II [Syncephalastrum racemosum]|uniref:Transcription elongation factor n=1 Tax=Syncephalastrum racemosum TaxID=13706 RepID=A0A1X2H1I5_SYNRA|nr:transcription elongation factor S-II [Syncephalastrum racemosum]
MSTEESIAKAKRALLKASETKNSKDMIDIMDNLIKIKATQDLLRKTDIGKTLGKLRTSEDVAVSQKAKAVVKKWKDDVVLSAKQASQPKPKSPPSEAPSTKSTPSNTASPPSDNAPPRTVKTDDVKFDSTGSTPRDKTIELMYGAVALGSFADTGLLLKRAMAIEKAVFEEFGSVNDGYKGKVRSLALNLKSKSNPGLRESIASGELPVTKLCKMSVEDMASEESKARDRKLAEEALFKARGAGSAQAETDMFICGKCKGRRCTYFQMQTRSADEPMTTFVTCVNCNNHWKFC